MQTNAEAIDNAALNLVELMDTSGMLRTGRGHHNKMAAKGGGAIIKWLTQELSPITKHYEAP